MNSVKSNSNGRMDMGLYALNKLACAGSILMLLTIVSWMWPQGAASPASILGTAIPLEHWVYGYALTASLAADAVISLVPMLGKMKQATLYGAAGFLFFALLTDGSSNTLWIRGAAGVLMLMMYLGGKPFFTGQSLLTLFFALVAPLLCWSIL